MPRDFCVQNYTYIPKDHLGVAPQQPSDNTNLYTESGNHVIYFPYSPSSYGNKNSFRQPFLTVYSAAWRNL